MTTRVTSRAISLITLLLFFTTLSAVAFFLVNTTERSRSVSIVGADTTKLERKRLPKNEKILSIIETYGAQIAPNYEDVVCTEFVIDVLERITPLSVKTKKGIRIITDGDLASLIAADASVIKGVQSALLEAGIGEVVSEEEIREGDLVQFWDVSFGIASGHCGFVVDARPHDYLTMYSSHPRTGGFGKQTFSWPDKTYFVRLK